MLAAKALPVCLVFGLGWVGGCEGASAKDSSEAMSADTLSTGQTEDSESGGTGELVAIVDNAQWQAVDAVADPLADHRPVTVTCGLAGWYREDEKLEIDTNNCNYLALRQPSLVALEVGQPVKLGLYYFDLVAPSPASAHIAILVNGELVWEDNVAIPGEAQVYSEVFESPVSAPAGSEVVLHLHNHGQNTWTFQELLAEQ
ncbi:hypothetical protein DB30_03946 [Enhygromyxa salina]|uniref:Uncharacterized protein n=1 Tax=Enhygromyxa salina TaxID=215803 RepID=A0A0C2DAQ1_9BACT|nr:hypothetical protein [Enhygromyxa salina]KIG16962.1 hypothetical protein DB30_03946 [Enhygromyxa salina]